MKKIKIKKYNIKKLISNKGKLEKVILKDENSNNISVNLITPKNKQTDSVIIIAPGLAALKENSTKNLIIPNLLERNINCVIFDTYGHGESSGKIVDFTISKLIDEIESIIDFLHSKKYKRILFSILISGILTSLIFGSSYISYYQKNGNLTESHAFLMENIISDLEGNKSDIYHFLRILYFLGILISFFILTIVIYFMLGFFY